MLLNTAILTSVLKNKQIGIWYRVSGSRLDVDYVMFLAINLASDTCNPKPLLINNIVHHAACA